MFKRGVGSYWYYTTLFLYDRASCSYFSSYIRKNMIQARKHPSCRPACDVRKWDVNEITCMDKSSQAKYAVLILNRPITQTQEFVRNFWNSATIRMTVDGGTNKWDSFVNNLPEDLMITIKLPDLITGDFDSITEDVLKKYKDNGCKGYRDESFSCGVACPILRKTKTVSLDAIHTPNQEFTDFTKAVMELNTLCQQQEIELDNVIAVAQNSGRIDQTLGNIQTLFLAKEKQLLPNTNLYIVSDDSLSWLLDPGHHEIIIPENSRKHKRAWCSMVPIGETCQSVTSSGLKWNLDDQPLKFGELVSTSNTFTESELVKITCSHTILWSMKVPSFTGS